MNLALGRWLRQKRRSAGMTLAQAGAHVGRSHQHMQKIETGKNRLPAPGLLVLIAIYGATADEMLDAVGLRPPPDPVL